MLTEYTKKIIDSADVNIPVYTKHLEFLRNFEDIVRDAMLYFDGIIPNNNNEELLEISKMNNFNSLLTIALLDLFVVCKNFLSSQHDWEKLYFHKQAYLIIYETINTYNIHSGETNSLIQTKYSTLVEQYKSVSRRIKMFKKEFFYEGIIAETRNKVAAHIDYDFTRYYDTLLKMKNESSINTISSFLAILMELQDLSTKMMVLGRERMETDKHFLRNSLDEIILSINKKIDSLRQEYENKNSNNVILYK